MAFDTHTIAPQEESVVGTGGRLHVAQRVISDGLVVSRRWFIDEQGISFALELDVRHREQVSASDRWSVVGCVQESDSLIGAAVESVMGDWLSL